MNEAANYGGLLEFDLDGFGVPALAALKCAQVVVWLLRRLIRASAVRKPHFEHGGR
jgi:hypothetical protein